MPLFNDKFYRYNCIHKEAIRYLLTVVYLCEQQSKAIRSEGLSTGNYFKFG